MAHATPLRPVDFFLYNLTKPDNIALVIMFFFTIVILWVSIREMMINDRLIKDGKKDKIYERMSKS